jgi:hypothetical protein
MKTTTLLFCTLFTGIALLSSCRNNEDRVFPTSKESSARKAAPNHFSAHLTSDQEVRTPAVVSTAQGQFTLKQRNDGTWEYKLIVAQLENVVGAHLHLAPVGSNGGIVIHLLHGTVNGSVNGVLSEGTITATDLTGALAGKTLDDLVAAISAGNIYVNVHTTAYTSGEIRGQVD